MRIVQMLGCILISMIITQLMIAMQHQTLARIDVKALEGQFIRQLAERNVPDAQAQQAAKKFKTIMHHTLHEYSVRNRAVLIDTHSVIAGGEDVTALLAQKIAQAMRSTV